MGARRLRGMVAGDGVGSEDRAFRSGLREGILRADFGIVMDGYAGDGGDVLCCVEWSGVV